MITAMSIILTFLDLIFFTGCAAVLIYAIPQDMHTSGWIRGGAWAGYAVLAVLLPRFESDILTVAVLTVYYLLLGRLLYYRSKMGILCQCIYCTMMLATQLMAIFLAACLMTQIQLDYSIYSYLIIILKIFFLSVCTILMRMIVKKRFAKDQSVMKIRGMILVPVFSMILIFFTLISGEVFFIRFGYQWFLIYCLLVLVINFYCLYFWYDVAKNGELKHRLKLMQQQNEFTLQYYEEMEKNYNHSRKIIHDIRNHLHAIEQAGRLEDAKYIEDVHDMLNSLGLKFYTENRMLNIILNDKLKTIPQEQVDCNLNGIRLDGISDMDITTIFANLLDNAAEAGKGRQDFQLKIRGEQIQDFTVIKISNPFRGTYEPGLSQKEGHEGLGLQNVRQTLEKYHGEMKIEQNNQVFSVTLAFPGAELKEEKR